MSMEEDIMEWMDLEPPMHENVECKDNSIQKKNKEKNNSNAKIEALKIKNSYLRQKIKRLKILIQTMEQTCKCKKLNKKKQEENKKKGVLKNLINKQELHPVAKIMINLQLHTPRTRYTEEEKMLSKQLYYYSASAFCRLKKAGCNFPG